MAEAATENAKMRKRKYTLRAKSYNATKKIGDNLQRLDVGHVVQIPNFDTSIFRSRIQSMSVSSENQSSYSSSVTLKLFNQLEIFRIKHLDTFCASIPDNLFF